MSTISLELAKKIHEAKKIKGKLIQLFCDYCGAEVVKYPSNVRGSHTYCNNKCRGMWQTTRMEKHKMNVKILREYLDYNKDTGRFIWKKNTSTIDRVGKIAGRVKKDGYRAIGIKGVSYLEHHLVWLYFYGKMPQKSIDHINGVTDDNRVGNLREVGQQVNAMNNKRSKRNTSGITGVWWHKQIGKWCAEIMYKGKKYSLGVFEEIRDAELARKYAEKHFGFSERHGSGS